MPTDDDAMPTDAAVLRWLEDFPEAVTVAELRHAIELGLGPALSGGPGTPRGEAAGVWLTPDEVAAMEQAELPIDTDGP